MRRRLLAFAIALTSSGCHDFEQLSSGLLRDGFVPDHGSDIFFANLDAANAGRDLLPGLQLSFGADVPYPIAGTEGHLNVADIDGDGALDLCFQASLNGSVNPSVYVMRGRGDGTFAPSSVLVASAPGSVAVYYYRLGDLNGDHHPDVLVTDVSNPTSAFVSFINLGNGVLQKAGSVNFQGNTFTAVMGDFDGDGRTDLVQDRITGADPLFSYFLEAYYGEIGGTLSAAFPIGTQQIDAIATGDFDGDGTNDLALSAYAMPADLLNTIAARKDRSFKSPVLLGNGGDPYVGDFDGDGRADILSVHPPSLIVYRSDNAGGFKPAVTTAADSYLFPLAVGDFDRDGNLDAAYMTDAAAQSLSLRVVLGKGDGSFKPPVEIGAPGMTGGSLVAGDFNGDGKPDLAYDDSANVVHVRLNTSR